MSSIFEELICCDLCEGDPENTLQIPCFHSFCKKCLTKNLSESMLICPICKMEHMVPNGSIEKAFKKSVLSKFWLNWHKNYFDKLKNAGEELPEIDGKCEDCVKQQKNTKNKVQTENCIQKIKDCYHCKRKLCESCRNKHYMTLRQDTFKSLENYQEGSRNLSTISETLNEARLKKIAEYEKLKSDIAQKRNDLIKKIESEEKEILKKLENEIKEDRENMLRANHDVKKFNAIKEASKTIREKITSEKDNKVLAEVCKEFFKVQSELKQILSLEAKRIDPTKEKKLVFNESKTKDEIMGVLETKKGNLKIRRASIPTNDSSSICTII